jgi:uncharacterized protein (TIGR00251 family)
MTAAEPRLIEVKVQPRAKRAEVTATGPHSLTVKVTAPPSRGEANEDVRELLAGHFHVPVSRVRIVRGEKSRHKLVALDP